MELLPTEIKAKLPPLYSQDGKGDAVIAYVKFFHPLSNWTWYATEFDGDDLFFGLVQGFAEELGYFSLSEMQSIQVNGLGIRARFAFPAHPIRSASQVGAERSHRPDGTKQFPGCLNTFMGALLPLSLTI
jgi:hypothetical protein